jgi:hypothetical protein
VGTLRAGTLRAEIRLQQQQLQGQRHLKVAARVKKVKAIMEAATSLHYYYFANLINK